MASSKSLKNKKSQFILNRIILYGIDLPIPDKKNAKTRIPYEYFRTIN